MTINTYVPSSVTPQGAVTTDPVVVRDSALDTYRRAVAVQATPKASSNPDFTFFPKINRFVSDQGPSPIMVRGFIRRSSQDVQDPTSQYRLNFMFNPESIQRQYVAYLDQQALDPTNANASGNMAAAPGITDFSFELFFDRQIEAGMASARDGVPQDLLTRGVLVDYEYFDRVVRGVDPTAPVATTAVPDNGVMLVNPNNITVVFSDQLAVQGRPYNATVAFEKFTSQMVPTRARIQLVLKALYIGPVNQQPANISTHITEQLYTATVPYEESVAVSVKLNEVPGTLQLSSVYTPQMYPTNVQAVARSQAPGAAPNNGTSVGPGGGQAGPGRQIFNPPPGKQWQHGTQSVDQMADLIVTAGIRDVGRATLWVSIAHRESSFNSYAHNPVPPDDSWGFFQINVRPEANPKFKPYDLTDPWTNVMVMMQMSGNGNNTGPWATNLDGSSRIASLDVRKYFGESSAAVQRRLARG